MGVGPVVVLAPVIWLVILSFAVQPDLKIVAVALAVGLLLTVGRVLWWRRRYGRMRIVATDESLNFLVGNRQVRTAAWADIGYIRFSRGIRVLWVAGLPALATLKVRATSDLGGREARRDFAQLLLTDRSYEQAATQLEAECRRQKVDYFDDLGNHLAR